MGVPQCCWRSVCGNGVWPCLQGGAHIQLAGVDDSEEMETQERTTDGPKEMGLHFKWGGGRVEVTDQIFLSL